MTHDISPEEARRLLDEDRQRASHTARLQLARGWLKASLAESAFRRAEFEGEFSGNSRLTKRVYTPFGDFTVAELEGT